MQVKAHMSISLSISDGISTSLLEAMAMGSFHIQSNTAAADEWIKDGQRGFIVPPEDPDQIELAIRKALTDDEMVDNAERLNYITISEKAEYNLLKRKTINMYEYVSKSGRKNNAN